MNDVLDQIKSRRSVRKYKAEMPSKEVIEKIIEAGLTLIVAQPIGITTPSPSFERLKYLNFYHQIERN